MGNEIVIKTYNLVKTFDGIDIITKCNMTVEKGSIYGLLGVNGAGKTTIFKMLMGLTTPVAGKIEILGMEISKHKNEFLKNIGSMIDTPIFYEHLSSVENLELHNSYMGAKNPNIEGVLKQVGLEHTNTNPVSKYSLGMRQRLGIARALAHKPRLLILDEPINGLDPIGICEIRDLFLKLKQEQNMTILISSHILKEIEHIADTIGVISNGTVKEIALSTVKEQFPNGLEDYFFNITSGGNKNA